MCNVCISIIMRIPSDVTVGKTSKSKLESHPANPLLGMMSNYHSDDEDGHPVDDEEKVVEKTESSTVTVEATTSKKSQLDEQVADFLRVRVSNETFVFKIDLCMSQTVRELELTVR